MCEGEMQTGKGELTILLKGTGMQETLVKLGNGFLFLQQDFEIVQDNAIEQRGRGEIMSLVLVREGFFVLNWFCSSQDSPSCLGQAPNWD